MSLSIYFSLETGISSIAFSSSDILSSTLSFQVYYTLIIDSPNIVSLAQMDIKTR